MAIGHATMRQIAEERLKDARALEAAGRYDGAVYMCGYVVELALKARIVLTLDWASWPDTAKEFEGRRDLKTHALDNLLRFTGQETKIRTQYLQSWSLVESWNPETCYQAISSVSAVDVTAIIAAADELLREL